MKGKEPKCSRCGATDTVLYQGLLPGRWLCSACDAVPVPRTTDPRLGYGQGWRWWHGKLLPPGRVRYELQPGGAWKVLGYVDAERKVRA